MKKIIFMFATITVLFSCQKESLDSYDLEEIETVQNVVKDESTTKQTNCNISGSTLVSGNTTRTFTYTTDISNSTITWTVLSGNITITSGQGTSSASFRFGSSFAGGSIRAVGQNGALICSDVITIAGICQPKTPRITVASPQWGLNGETCPSQILEVFANNVDSGVTNYEWKIYGATFISSNTNTNSILVRTSSSVGIYVDFKVRTTSSCGTSAWATKSGRTINCSGGGGYY